MSATRKEIVREAKNWLEVPWRHQGYSKKFGCDCIGLIHGVGTITTALTVDPKDLMNNSGYSRNPNPQFMRRILRAFFKPIPLIDARVADILWFRIGKYPRHLGIITEPGIVIHSDGVEGKVIEHRMATSRIRMPVAAFQFPLVI